MGTSWSVKVLELAETSAGKNGNGAVSRESIQTVLDTVEDAMSNWKESSEVSKLNNMPAGCLLISKHTEAVARASEFISQQSQGYFDVTLSPLIELWGFGTQGEPPVEPAAEVLQDLISQGDYRDLSSTERQLCKSKDGIQVNYSAIAKGYAVDEIARYLFEAGYKNFLVEVGGELYGSGVKSNGEAWKIGVEKPSYGFDQQLYSTLELNGQAVATSGDYRNYYELDSVRYSHILNPKTGKPVTHNTASVTVVHESAMYADGWATALLAAGAEKGMELAEEHQLKVFMILHHEDGFKELASRYWIETFASPRY